MRPSIISVASALALVAATAAQAAPELVTNGGFENGLDGWNANGWGSTVAYGGVGSYEGNLHAYTGCVNSFCTLSQNIATQAGARYDISFAFNPGNNVLSGGGQTNVYFGDQLLTSIVGGANAYTVYNFADVAASGASTALLFSGFQNPAWNGVDAVSVQASGAVPEPTSWALMLGGFGAIGGVLRSRRKLAVSFG